MSINQTQQLNIYYDPYDKQKEIHKSKAKTKIVCLGRRSGKTFCGVAEILSRIKNHKSQRPLQIAWIAPTYSISKRGEDTLRIIARDLIAANIIKIGGQSPRTATFGPHTIYFLSSDNDTSIRGFAFDLIVLDEGAYISDTTFSEVILPTLMDNDGDLLSISTPRGKFGWFFMMAMKASSDPDIDFFQWSSYDNPYLPKSAIDRLADSMPEHSRQQEIYAQFIDHSGSVFRDPSKCFSTRNCDCKDNGEKTRKIVGLDLARHVDFTVLTAVCPKCRHVTAMDRFNQLDWTIQRDRIKKFYNKNNALKIVIDENSIGDVIAGDLRADGLRVEGFKFTNASKNKLVTDLVAAVEKVEIQWDHNKYPEFESEMVIFECKITNAGNTTYNAIEGGHDDCIISLGLALHGILGFKSPKIHLPEEEGQEINFWSDEENLDAIEWWEDNDWNA